MEVEGQHVGGGSVALSLIDPAGTTTKGIAMSEADAKRLYERWLALWNGDLAGVGAVVAPDFTLHQVGLGGPLDPEEFRGPDGLVRLIGMGRAPFAELTFRVEVGPIVEGDMLAARWTGAGIYRGGLPGATAPAGTPVTFGGNDLLRIVAGKVAEYWVSSDGLYLMAQLGVIGTAT